MFASVNIQFVPVLGIDHAGKKSVITLSSAVSYVTVTQVSSATSLVFVKQKVDYQVYFDHRSFFVY